MNAPEVLPLNLIVVGASIAGLTAAFALAEAGHNVVVLEKNRGNELHTGSIRCPPNLSRIFHEHPIIKKMYLERGVKTKSIIVREGSQCADIGLMVFPEELMRDCGADFYLHTYDDIRKILLDLCDHYGVTIHYGCQVKRAEGTTDGVDLFLVDERRFHADVVVAADGRESTLRQYVSDYDETNVNVTEEIVSMRWKLPFKDVAQDPELALFAEEDVWSAYFCDGVIFSLTPHPLQNEVHFWVSYRPPGTPDLRRSFTHLDPRIQKAIDLGKSQWIPEMYNNYAVNEWVGLQSRAVLIGDAAHASTPDGTYNASMAVEDGIILAELLGKVTSKSQIPVVLGAFQDLRQPRAESNSYGESQRFVIQTLPPELTVQRDAELKVTLQMRPGEEMEFNNELLATTWGTFVDAYAYDSRLVAQGWWKMWGSNVWKR
ncbi:hypothetical protein DL96DRAFT_1609766 [Flagelloscypha sp. PMI_526]|nr:hypothetical protein DL96DRAFT_1609766 [Flagelloscypha sp. PMI_526]